MELTNRQVVNVGGLMQGLKRLRQVGGNGLCECEYAVTKDAEGQRCIVFVQGLNGESTISTEIKALATKVLMSDLGSLDARGVRFFEHYPRATKRAIEWKEVIFREKRDRDAGLMKRLLKAAKGASGEWEKAEPMWVLLEESDVPAEVLRAVRWWES